MYYSAEYHSFRYQLDDDNKLPPKIPVWLELPKGSGKNRNANILGDFLMLAEGSEVEGPIPRLVIPKMGNGDFNLDHFAVCLMSTDMQTQNGLLNFGMKGDAQLLMSQNDEGLFSFVQHFTLHDAMARGFVRPFCLAYLSQDRNKLIHFQDRLSFEFNRVVSHYKVGNFLLFFRDMLHTFSDLQYTRERHLEGMETGVSQIYDDDYDDLMSGQPAHISKIVDVVGNPLDKLQENTTFNVISSNHIKALSCSNLSIPSDKFNCLSKIENNSEEDNRFMELEEDPLHQSESKTFLDDSHLVTVSKDDNCRKEILVKKSPNDTPFKTIKDPKVQLKEFDDAIKEVRGILTMVSNLLDNHHVEVKEQFTPRLDESLRETPLDSKNFNMAQHLENPSHNNQDFANIEPSWIKWTYAEDSYKPKLRKSLRVKIQKKLRNFELLTKPTFDGYELLHSLYRYFDRAHLTLTTELDDIKDLDPPEGLLTIGRVVYLNFLANFERSPRVHKVNKCSKVKYSKFVMNNTLPVNVLVKEWMSEKTIADFHACSSFGTSNAEIGHLHKSLESNEHNHFSASINRITSSIQDSLESNSSKEHLLCPSKGSEQLIPSRPTCLDLNPQDEKTPELGGSEKKIQTVEKASVICFADHISGFTNSKRIGSGILKMFRSFQSQTIDMIYSLLIGRTLIVYTSLQTNEADVRDIVISLWFFVPGHFNVLPWVTKSLSMQDLVRLRLAGMLKRDENLVPHHNHSSISFFDINRKKYLGPSYKCGLLLEVANKKLYYQDETSFLAYLYSNLFHLASKSFLYFHAFCMDDEEPYQESNTSWQKRVQKYEQFMDFSKSMLKVSVSDAYIVMYLSKVVKDQLRGKLSKEDGIHVSLNQPIQWSA